MSFNIFKRKEDPIYLDCYTYSHYAYNFAKIDHARKYIPDWWKSQPRVSTEGEKTIKYCSAVRDYYATGIVIPLWGEVEITVHPKGKSYEVDYEWRSSNEDFNLHSGNHVKDQWGGFGNDNLRNIKFISPWAIKTRDDVQFAWTQPTWSQPDTFNWLTLLPGVIQFKTQMGTNVNYVIESGAEEQKIRIEPLTPIAMLHPMTERKIELRHHLIDVDKYSKLHRKGGGMLLDGDSILDPNSRINVRNRKFWKKSDELNECPFK